MYRRTTEAHVAPDSGAHSAARGGEMAGSTLLEVLIALGIVAIALTFFVSILQLSVHSVTVVHEQTTAAILARSQMETIKSAAWPGPYSTISAPPGFTVLVASAPGPIAAIQVITVRVQADGRDILTVQGYKGQR
jgi:type II secretory pathway pseudopilin PulG